MTPINRPEHSAKPLTFKQNPEPKSVSQRLLGTQDIFQMVLRLLSFQDVQAFSSTSKELTSKVLKATNLNKRKEVNHLILHVFNALRSTLIESSECRKLEVTNSSRKSSYRAIERPPPMSLPKRPVDMKDPGDEIFVKQIEKKALENLEKSMIEEDFPDLPGLKNHLLQARNRMIHLFKNLPRNRHFDTIASIEFPEFFELPKKISALSTCDGWGDADIHQFNLSILRAVLNREYWSGMNQLNSLVEYYGRDMCHWHDLWDLDMFLDLIAQSIIDAGDEHRTIQIACFIDSEFLRKDLLLAIEKRAPLSEKTTQLLKIITSYKNGGHEFLVQLEEFLKREQHDAAIRFIGPVDWVAPFSFENQKKKRAHLRVAVAHAATHDPKTTLHFCEENNIPVASLVKACARAAEFEVAFELVKLKSINCNVCTLHKMLAQLIKAGKADEVFSLIESQNWTSSLGKRILPLIRVKKIEKTSELVTFTNLIYKASESRSFLYPLRLLEHLVTELIRTGEIKRALQFINSNRQRPFNWNQIISTLAEAQEFQKALQLCKYISYKDHKSLALIEIAKGFAKADLLKEAIKSLNEASLILIDETPDGGSHYYVRPHIQERIDQLCLVYRHALEKDFC